MPHYELHRRFLIYPCGLDGYLIWKEEIYQYILAASAPLWMRNEFKEVSDEETVGFGCFNKKGEKYVFEIALDLDY
jgi:hypothetical protein